MSPAFNVFTIAAGAPFARALARGFTARYGSDPQTLAAATIYLPTRRAARLFADSFAAEMNGAALLPRFTTLGEADAEDADFDPLAEEFPLTPSISLMRRRLLLASLIERWSLARNGARNGRTMRFDQAAALASSLAAVMDEAETAGADFSKLADLAPETLAAHWEEVRAFLAIIPDIWPGLLTQEKAANPAANRNAALARLAHHLQAHPPAGPVIAAGSTGSVPATADLMAVIAALPNGAVVLPGLDKTLDETAWKALDPGHPQYGLQRLIARFGISRDSIADWCKGFDATPRTHLLSEVLRPAPATDAWRALTERGDAALQASFDGVTLEEAADPAEEAAIIALALRETLQTPGKTAALITRDRDLARRVAVLCRRWNILLDDSAGQPLPLTRAGSFFALITEAAEARFAPAPLLALLKHPLAAHGGRAQFLDQARKLDLALRGPRPDAGLVGVRAAIQRAEDASTTFAGLGVWFADIADALAPLEILGQRGLAALPDLIEAHLTAAQALAETEETLWAGADGESASAFFTQFRTASAGLPDIAAMAYPRLFALMLNAGTPVRPAYGRHPRLAILSPQEARLTSFDRRILAGLNEGSWPAAAPADPWFSRPMRRTLGLEQPERSIGLSAHDFATLAAGGEVLLTRALKSDGAPTVASRWLQRLQQLARGLGRENALVPVMPLIPLARALAETQNSTPIAPPRPTPPVSLRPRRLSVTEIETWLRDPYAIYARHVLKLRPLDPLDDEIGPMARGSILHKTLELFLRQYPHTLPDNPAAEMAAIAESVFAEARLPKAVLALWRPRFLRAIRWFAGIEATRRPQIAESFVEISGSRIFDAPAGPFRLVGKADRIDRLHSGGAAIIDYKTGAPPSEKQVGTHLSPQLSLEAAILKDGGFKEIGALQAAELIYIRIAGGRDPGELRPIKADATALAVEATERLAARIARFDDPSTPYDSRIAPMFARAGGDYDHLARLKEWSQSGWGEDA